MAGACYEYVQYVSSCLKTGDVDTWFSFLCVNLTKCFFFLPFLHSFLLLSVVLPRQSGTVCLATFSSSSMEMVYIANAACSLLWGKDIIWSMLGSHLVVLPSGETTSKAILATKVYKVFPPPKIQNFHFKFHQAKMMILCWLRYK